ncbi:hypothetical protein EV421DRAFT_2018159 [Armillaria borealis]|uniref:Uncharacterized protein n=1 Tax=Armillaria borealis TaxID=47425 RepID=A0AA39JNT0_9AGAR|nr:hypothetical protein EV421DRAFT_2018159 [Armillaria borealis]
MILENDAVSNTPSVSPLDPPLSVQPGTDLSQVACRQMDVIVQGLRHNSCVQTEKRTVQPSYCRIVDVKDILRARFREVVPTICRWDLPQHEADIQQILNISQQQASGRARNLHRQTVVFVNSGGCSLSLYWAKVGQFPVRMGKFDLNITSTRGPEPFPNVNGTARNLCLSQSVGADTNRVIHTFLYENRTGRFDLDVELSARSLNTRWSTDGSAFRINSDKTGVETL